ncbi:MAG: hypothetical protein ABSF37_08140 [Sedimentisphaerales bacterium]|jgi:hypothetical protein
MKKLSAILIVLVVFLMCSPSFGYTLIYNVSVPVKGADATSGLKISAPMRAILILSIDTLITSIDDANLIIYGNDTNVPKKQKVYVEYDFTTMDEFHYAILRTLGGYYFVDISAYTDIVSLEGFMMGKWKTQDVGPLLGGRQDVAGSLKGGFAIRDGFLLGPVDLMQDISGTADISASLWTSMTKWANGHNTDGAGGVGELKTQDQVVTWAIGYLTAKGYHPATLPSP